MAVKKLLPNILFVILLLALFSQLSPVLVIGYEGIGGSFGIRPITHDCFGIVIGPSSTVRFLPKGDIEFRFIYFHFRYFIPSELVDPFCVGQDIVLY